MTEYQVTKEAPDVGRSLRVNRYTRLTVYWVKLLCGEFKGSTAAAGQVEGPVEPGLYFTAINIHNPRPSRPVSLRRSHRIGSRTRPGNQIRGLLADYTSAKLTAWCADGPAFGCSLGKFF